MDRRSLTPLLLAHFLLACALPPDEAAAVRAGRLGSATLAMVRAERPVSLEGTEPKPEFAEAHRLFTGLVTRLDSGRFSEWVASGSGQWAEQIRSILAVAEKQVTPPRADPAAALLESFSRREEIAERWPPGKLKAYAAALQVIMEARSEIRMKLGLVDLLLEIGAPVMLSDLGLSRTDTTELEELAAEAANAADAQGCRSETTRQAAETTDASSGAAPPLNPAGNRRAGRCEAGDFFRVMVQLDDLGGRFGGRLNEKDLAGRLMETERFQAIRDQLALLPPATLCFFGDSQTDNRHWSSAAHYPAILAEVFRQLNPELKVINAGIGGDDSGEGLERIEKDVLTHQPDVCFVLFGGNDCNHHGGPQPTVSPEQFYSNMNEITVKLQAIGSKPVLMTYPPSPNEEPRENRTLSQMNEALARVRQNHDTGWLAIGQLIDGLDSRWMFAVDDIHFSPDGHLEISMAVLQYLVNGLAPEGQTK